MQTKRTIVVTGISRGLGRQLLNGFVSQGHTVVGCARNQDSIEQIRTSHGSEHRFDVVDVSNNDAVESWAHEVLATHGPPSLIVNNAAVINRNTELWNIQAEEFSHIVDVNIKGTFHVLRAFLPAMIEAGEGVIVNLSSGWGRSTSPEVAPYCATKWAIEGLTQSLAKELPRGLAAVPVNPGVINTDMLQSTFGDMASSYQSPEEWARKAVPFLLQLGPADNGVPSTVP